MRSVFKVYLTCALLALTAGPALGLPRLSLHAPTLAPLSAPSPAPAPVPVGPLSLIGLAGAIKVKDTGAVAAKWKTRASAASQDYASGVAGAGSDWESGARLGESNYETAVVEAIGRKAFGKGIAAAGSAKYVDNATKLGAQRYPSGVGQAEAAYNKGVGPFLDVLKGLTLPPAGPRGSAMNQDRANAVAKALRMKKVNG